jgi:hypothetical protein
MFGWKTSSAEAASREQAAANAAEKLKGRTAMGKLGKKVAQKRDK